jgi:hypothetical protein
MERTNAGANWGVGRLARPSQRMTCPGSGPARSLHNLYYQTHTVRAKVRFPAALLLLAVSTLGASCAPATPPAIEPTTVAPQAPPSAPPGPVVPPGPAAMPLASAQALHAGTATPLSPGVTVAVEPASSFEIRIAAPARDARLVLLDAQDFQVPATVEAEVGSDSRFLLVPLEPLRPGSAYLLRLEGLGARLVRSDGGRSFEPLVLPLQISGSPPPRAPQKKASKKRPG